MGSRAEKTISFAMEGTVGLFQEILNRGLDLRVSVTGTSMAPIIDSGDTVIIKKVDPDKVTIGDLLFFRNRVDLPVLHRLIRSKRTAESGRLFSTKGDAVGAFDEPFSEQSLMGKVVLIEKGLCEKHKDSLDMESFKWRAINIVIAVFQALKQRFNECRNLIPRYPLN